MNALWVRAYRPNGTAVASNDTVIDVLNDLIENGKDGHTTK
jgi:hypothetical protein